VALPFVTQYSACDKMILETKLFISAFFKDFLPFFLSLVTISHLIWGVLGSHKIRAVGGGRLSIPFPHSSSHYMQEVPRFLVRLLTCLYLNTNSADHCRESFHYSRAIKNFRNLSRPKPIFNNKTLILKRPLFYIKRLRGKNYW
jgi:hypothetical protein